MQTFGIDIGTSSIKIAQVVREGAKFRLLAAAAVPTPPPGVKSESVADLNKVAEAVKKAVDDARISTRHAVCSIAESSVHLEVLQMPPMNEGELASAVIWEAEQVIPFQVSEAELSWQVLPATDQAKANNQQVLLTASPKRQVEKYVSLLNEAGLTTEVLEPESIATARSVGKFQSGLGAIIGLGASGTSISVVLDGAVIISRTLPTGGNAISRALSSYLNLELNQAEEYKRAYGLEENQLEGKVRQAILPVVDVIANETRKVIEFYQSKNENRRISSVVLTGGGAGLPELVPYLAKSLGAEITVGDSFADIIKDDRMTKALTGFGPLYGVAVGLALREVEG